MGKGGSASTLTKERSALANTIPQTGGEITKRSLRDVIPAHCFERSYSHSLGTVAWDLIVVAWSAWLVHAVNSSLPEGPLGLCLQPLVWLAYWWYQGLTFTGLWVIAHECGHGGFTDSRLVNDVVGFVLHSSLVTPYFSWAITHAKHHHYTNHMTMGETWVPSTADPNKSSVKFAKTPLGTLKRTVIVALIGWYTYLCFNATGARQNLGQSHFNPKSRALFKPKDAAYVRLSNVGVVAALGAIGYAMSVFGAGDVVRYYLVPQMIANFYLCAITFMQHTHPDVPHFNEDQWTWLRGALSTIDRSMGPFCDYKLHHIVDSHVVHHIFSDMPFYGAKEATPYVAAHLGKYYKSAMPKPVLGSQWIGYWGDFWVAMRSAVSVGPEEGSDFLWFK